MWSEGNVQLFIAIWMSQFPTKAQAENSLWKNLFKNVLACIIDEVHCIMDWDEVLSTGCINKMYLILLLNFEKL